ncbi:META domain-containing protein [Rudanella paleaurantiibacter]|uniref:META domain-containing protein n=1 Tax=Rudanella paleaurantiibacter TaxID=2614655 RepID=A0A7J5U493_9BACT|nr:META domain-containing protein [Rudanella paleaurantiibacter]KAB7732659.1 META domain-containing protein [Rudanella paleaurantiibacter]
MLHAIHPLKSGLLALVALLTLSTARAQSLQPGFDPAEYIELMKVSARFGDSTYVASYPAPQRFKPVYRSPIVGLDNRWDLWTDNAQTAVISLRGTTANSTSWLANFYAAMVPAKGDLQISDTETFAYNLAENPKAAVHVGWLVATAFLSKDILPKLDSSYQKGVRNILVMGHSQGGAIAYLLTAHLYNLQKSGRLPADMRLKTYCSAGPKPGNLYFAYEYEAMTQGGWGFNVVNSADWVPEVPLSIQTLNDFNVTNPFSGAPDVIKKQKLLNRIVLKHVYNNLTKPALKAQRNYQKYLGTIASKTVRKNLNGYVAPEYYNSNHYVRTGQTIVLRADSAYFVKYPESKEKIFAHHFHPPYLFLTERQFLGAAQTGAAGKNTGALGGSWELNYISGPRIAFGGLYPEQKPTLTFGTDGRLSGNTSCNAFNGPVTVSGNGIRFADSMAMTRKMCPGEGETVFLNTLKRVNRYALSDPNTLVLLTDDVAVMRFTRK